MQPLQVVSRFLPALGFGQDVVDFDRVFRGEVESTGLTSALLPFEESGHVGFHFRMASQSCAPIDPVAVIRTLGALHFHVAPVWRVVMAVESYLSLCRLKRPALTVVHAPVFAGDPVFGVFGCRRTAQAQSIV